MTEPRCGGSGQIRNDSGSGAPWYDICPGCVDCKPNETLAADVKENMLTCGTGRGRANIWDASVGAVNCDLNVDPYKLNCFSRNSSIYGWL